MALERINLRGVKALESSVSMPSLGAEPAKPEVPPLVEHHHYHFHYGHKATDKSGKIPLTGDLQCTVPSMSPEAQMPGQSGPQRVTSLPSLSRNTSAGRSVASKEWRVGAPPRVRKILKEQPVVSPKESAMPRVVPPHVQAASNVTAVPAESFQGDAEAISRQRRPLRAALKQADSVRHEAPSHWMPAPVTPTMLLPQTEVRRRPRLESLKVPSQMPIMQTMSGSLEQQPSTPPLASPSGSSSNNGPALKPLKSLEAMDTMQLWSSYNLAKDKSDVHLKRAPGWVAKGGRRQKAMEQKQARRQARRKECQRHLSEMEDDDSKRRYVEGMLSPANQPGIASPRVERRAVFDEEPSWKEKQEMSNALQSVRNISSALQDCSRQRQELVKMQNVLKKVEEGHRKVQS
mmetsp:Transcript_15001/g.34172  ORF Transcript_15001/g.34172 Transcript_15001/m.34172 type:complete len:404 (+) Transcript_15001:1-1212(+)